MNQVRFGNSQRRVLALAVGVALLVLVAAAAARPGSGHSYSGSSRSRGGGYSGGGYSGGGGGGDGGFIIELLFWLLFRNPMIGIPIIVIVIVFALIQSASKSKMQGWSTTPAQVSSIQPSASDSVPRAELDSIRTLDSHFSLVLFEDFVYLLYAAFQRARATGMSSIAAYIDPELAKNLGDSTLAEVHGVIIGAMRIVRFSGTRGSVISVEIEVEANFVERPRSGPDRRFYVVDRLLLERSASARSRSPERSRKLDCPNCGAPLEAVRGTQCNYCHEDVGLGRFDWMIRRFSNRTCEHRGPLLTSDVQEEGTDLPTIVDAGASGRFSTLQQRDPSLTFDGIQARTASVFQALQVAWSTRDAAKIRPYVTDNLFQSMVYWIDLYNQQHCRNVTENTRIVGMELSNILSDAYFDAVTLRIFATGIDYTISDDGQLLSGSRSRPRAYSEYWTLIRATGTQGKGDDPSQCPNCHAPLRVGMTGNCEYCQAKVTSGKFDWVLSRIEQDEAYTG